MELFKLFGSILIDDKDAIKSLKDTQKSAKDVNKAMGELGDMAKKAGKVIATGIGVGAAAIGGLVMKTTESLDRIDKLSQKIGMSREAFQKWDYVLGQNGISIDVLQGGFKKMVGATDDLLNGSKLATENFAKLGLSADDLRGKTKEDVFNTIITELQKMPDSVERAAIANDLLGKSASELAPLLNQSADATQDLMNRAGELGLVMNDETIDAGVKFQDTMDDVKKSFETAAMKIGAEFIPKLQEMLDWVIAHMPEIQEFFRVAFETVGNMLGWVSDNLNWILPLLAGMLSAFLAFKVITTIVTIFGLFKTIIAGSTGVMAIFNAVMAANPIVLIAIGIGLLIGAIVLLIMNFDKVKQAAQNLWNGIKDIFGKMGEFVKNIFASFKDFIKLPKFEVKGTLNPLKWISEGLPKLNVKWNAEGGIFDSPTIFGTQYGLQGVGEAGPEAIMPLSKLQDLLDMNGSIDYKRLAHELKNAMSGMSVVLDDQKVGAFVDTRLIKGVL